MLLEKAIELFLENCKALDRSPKTIAKYKYSLTRFEQFVSQQYNRPVYVYEIQPDDMERFLFQKFNPQKYSTSMRHDILTAFKSLYSYMERKKICENKGKLIKYEKVINEERQTLSEIEFRRAVQYIKSNTPRAVVHILYYAGLRVQEALNLKIEDVDFNDEVLHIKDTKNKEDRTVPMNARLKKVLSNYLQNERIGCRTDYFFSTFPNGEITAQQINKQLKRALQKAGIDRRITAHCLRHSFASNLIQRGVDVVTLRNLLGHKNIRTTSIYCHTTIEELAEAINVL